MQRGLQFPSPPLCLGSGFGDSMVLPVIWSSVSGGCGFALLSLSSSLSQHKEVQMEKPAAAAN